MALPTLVAAIKLVTAICRQIRASPGGRRTEERRSRRWRSTGAASAAISSRVAANLPCSSARALAKLSMQRVDSNAPSVCIEGVLDELLQHRGGALDHLAGGDLADQFVGQFTNRAAR